jgi:2-polyprenyl-3-methyl-5-hydroxy-6-metoxy-1,4-benzoquinol methylase
MPPLGFDDPGIPEIESEGVGACALCDGSALRDFATGFDYELRTCRNRWTFRECESCGHVQLDPRPTPATLGVIYPPHYYSYNMEEQVNAFALKGKEILDRLKFSSILKSLGRKPRAFVDVGCGDGRYLRLLERTHGLPRDQLYGLELSEQTVERLRESGYKAYCERAESCDAIPAGSIDLVTMFHVIEHVADPAAVARKVAGWLAPGGVFALETPNLSALDARLFKKSFWGGYHIPRHWHLFRETTLAALLQGAGLEVLEMRYQTGHSFWMYSLHHALRYRFGLVRLSRWFDPLRGLPFLIAFTGIDKVRAAMGFRTSAVLVIARKPAH